MEGEEKEIVMEGDREGERKKAKTRTEKNKGRDQKLRKLIGVGHK